MAMSKIEKTLTPLEYTAVINKLIESLNRSVTGGGGFPILQRETAYDVGDCVKDASLPSWVYFECVESGTTATADLSPEVLKKKSPI